MCVCVCVCVCVEMAPVVWLLIIITRFIVLFIFPDSIACPCVRPYWWREVNIEQP